MTEMNSQKLKCRDLMVGDWIQDKHGMPMQVITVGQDYAYASIQDNECGPWEYDDKDEHPYAIELTGMMLGMNGWDKSISTIYTVYVPVVGDLPTQIEYDFYNNYLKIWFEFDKDYHDDIIYVDMLVQVTFVHELQHALRLAGLNDVANGFRL